MFVPDNAAFKPLEANLSRASTGRLAEIFKYHVLPKVRRIPRGFESGSFETLLKGHSVDINASRWAVGTGWVVGAAVLLRRALAAKIPVRSSLVWRACQLLQRDVLLRVSQAEGSPVIHMPRPDNCARTHAHLPAAVWVCLSVVRCRLTPFLASRRRPTWCRC
jgi:hypothetical protein